MGVYTYYFPIVAFPETKTKLHSLQLGWDRHNRIPLYEKALGLNGGGDQHLLDPANAMQTIQVEEWYAHWWKLGLEPHILTYNKADQCFRYPEEAALWIKAHPGKRWIIGNEPDGSYEMGGCEMSPAEYAQFYWAASNLIRSADPTAYLIMAGWAGGVGEPAIDGNNEAVMLNYYYQNYGRMDVQAFSFHVYQRDRFDNPYPENKLKRFCKAASVWKDLGWCETDQALLTEFGWSGLDIPNNTANNCMKFMSWYIPKLRNHPQITGWYWWEWGAGAMLMKDGEPTDVGVLYSNMRA